MPSYDAPRDRIIFRAATRRIRDGEQDSKVNRFQACKLEPNSFISVVLVETHFAKKAFCETNLVCDKINQDAIF